MSHGSQFTVKLDLLPTDNPSTEPFSLAHNGYKNSPVASVVFKDGNFFVANAIDGRQAVLPFSFKSVTEPDQQSALVKALVHFPGDVLLQQSSAGTQLTLGFK